MTYDEEKEINKKEIKYYSLKVENGNSLKKGINIENDTLIFNTGLKKKFILSKLVKRRKL